MINLRTGWSGERTESGTLRYTHPEYPFKISRGGSFYNVYIEFTNGTRTRIFEPKLPDLLLRLQNLADEGLIITNRNPTQ